MNMYMHMGIPTVIISMVLFFILFFGLGFLLNEILRKSWTMAIITPIVYIFFIDKVRFVNYFTEPASSLHDLENRIFSLAPADILILLSGFVGAIIAGFATKLLRTKGYRMF